MGRLLQRWFTRRTTVVAVLLVVSVFAAALLRSLRFGPSGAVGLAIYSVSVQYFGVDAEGMERLITVPLESAVAPLSGIDRLRSVSEYGKSTVEVALSPGTKANDFYLSLRDAVNTLSARLPRAVQRPVILGAASDTRPFFVAMMVLEGATLDETRNLADTVVKPEIERIDGVGEVEISGGSRREVHVLVDERRAAAAGLTPERIAGMLQRQYVLRPVGLLRTGAADLPVVLEGRFVDLDRLAALPLELSSTRSVRLRQVATVRYGEREVDTVGRVDGERRILISVKSTGSANVVEVGRALRKELAGLKSGGLSFDIVYDLGKQIEDSLVDVLRSLGIAAGVVTLFVAFALRPLRNAVLLAMLLPFTVLVTAALLAAMKIGVDRYILAGIGVGVGMVVDPGIIVVSALSARRGASTGERVGGLVSPLAASGATTIIVLVPLVFMGGRIMGLREVSYTLATMLGVSLAAGIFFVPAFTGACMDSRGPRRSFRGTVARAGRRGIDRVVASSSRHPTAVLAGAGAVCIAGVFAVPHMGLELGAPPDPSSVYAHIEFESGTPIEDIDRRTAELTQGVIGLPGVRHVETNARRESSDMTVTLDGRDGADERVRSVLTAGARNLPHAFLYLPSGPHGSGQAIEVSLMGPENLLLRSLAERTARALRGEPWVDQVVLNFKEGPPTYVFSVNHEDLSYYGLNTSEIARALRWSMYGPVVLKWFEPGSRQVDLRVRAEHTKAVDLDTIRSTGITGSTGRVVAVAQLGRFILTRPPSRIYRNDRRRAVYFTLHTPLHDTRAAVTYLQSFLRNNSLPFGYAFRIDRRIFDRLRRSQTLSILLFGAMVLVFVTLAVQTESLSSPLLVMSIVPFSLAVPIALLWARGSGLDVPVLVSLIIVSGMVVNNAILVVDTVQSRLAAVGGCGKQEIVRSMRYAVRRRTRALLLTSGTVVLGMFPFLFGTAANSELFRPLAYVLVWGTAASVAATFLVLPAVAAAAPVFVRRFPRIAE